MRRLLIGLFPFLLALMVVAPVPAHAAAEDVVEHLQVTYDVRADGTIRVTYELDWRFASATSHGINFDLVTAEPWDLDERMTAHYGISQIEVASPTGASTKVRREETQSSTGHEALRLRIGDGNKTVDAAETYVISYTMTGGLRTFDGHPELFLDVTTTDFPEIRRFTGTVQATGAIPRSRCLVGEKDCDASTDGARATLRATDIPKGTALSVVAELPKQQQGAQPKLRPRQGEAQKTKEHTAVTFDAHGVAHVEQRWTQHMGAAGQAPVRLHIPVRRTVGGLLAHRFDVTEPVVRDATGAQLPVRKVPLLDLSQNELLSSVDPWHEANEVVYEVLGPSTTKAIKDSQAQLSATWEMRGLVDSSGDTATVTLPVMSIYERRSHHASDEQHTFSFGGDVGPVTCLGDDTPCTRAGATTKGGTVTLQWTKQKYDEQRSLMLVEVPSEVVGGRTASLTLSVYSVLALIVAAVVAVATVPPRLFGALGRELGRRMGSTKDERYVDVPPGVRPTGEPATTRARFAGTVPVRFTPPDAPLSLVGHVWHRQFAPTTTAALLTHMAVEGAVTITSRPLSVTRADAPTALSAVEKRLWRSAEETPGRKLSRRQMTALNTVVRNDFQRTQREAELFRRVKSPKDPDSGPGVVMQLLAFIGFCAVIVWFTAPEFAAQYLPSWWAWALGLGVLGLWWWSAFRNGFRQGRHNAPQPLSAEGTLVREQAEGFRQYLSSVEARQLDLEADKDIFRRNLPWAVLFGETKRWVAVCQKLAQAGLIAPVDTSWVRFTDEVDQHSHRSYRWQLASEQPHSFGISSGSSGGSGSSSGFSSDSSGGGGGGGASASSW